MKAFTLSHTPFRGLALALLATACLVAPAMASPEAVAGRLAQADTAPGPMLQEPMGGQFDGTTLSVGLEDDLTDTTLLGRLTPEANADDADDDDRSEPAILSALMFLIMAAGIGGGILLMHAKRSDTATGTREYL